MPPILEAENLTKRYQDFTLRDVSIGIPRGCIVAFFGRTGAGKTTLMKLLAHQVPASSGTIRVFGLGYDEREKDIKNRIGYVPQETSFYADRSVGFNASFAASLFERWDGDVFYRMLDEFKISRKKTIKCLSTGQKTLLSIALALSHGADLLILDEPTAGLDIVLRRTILDRLRQFVANGERTVVAASQITDGLEEIAEYIHILDEGKLVFQSEKDELSAHWKRIHFREGALDHETVRRFIDVRVQPFSNSGLTRDFPAIRGQLAAGIASGDVRAENARLDEILIAMLEGE